MKENLAQEIIRPKDGLTVSEVDGAKLPARNGSILTPSQTMSFQRRTLPNAIICVGTQLGSNLRISINAKDASAARGTLMVEQPSLSKVVRNRRHNRTAPLLHTALFD